MKLRELLQKQMTFWKITAGINSAEIARRMGVSRSVISKMEKQPEKMLLETMARYAKACGFSKVVIRIDPDAFDSDELI